MKIFKKSFITGLVILLPIAVTVAIVSFFINFITKPFVGSIEHFFIGTEFYAKYAGLIHFTLQILFLVALFLFTVLLGFLARAVFFRWIISVYDYLLHRIPIIKTVYKATQQVIRTIFGSSSRSFKQVVMVPFPTHGAYCIGLISSPAPAYCSEAIESNLISVFVPTTPNPTSGYLIMYREEEVINIDMKVEEAFKYIISCGVITSNEPLDDLLAN
ncbi:MAG: DUF502 domain-containing protein [Chlamydiales bacterium]